MNGQNTSIIETQSEPVCLSVEEAFLDQSCQTAKPEIVEAKRFYLARPYQADCLAKLSEMRAQGTDRGIVVMACGLGKTVTIILDVERFLGEHPGSRVLYLCHNGEILAGAKEKFEAHFGSRYSYGFFMTYANKIEADDTQKKPTFLFASFQTMNRRRTQFAPDEFDYIIVDEAHHVQAKTFAPTVRYFEPKFQLGATATPFRMDGKKIEELLGEVVYNMDIVRGVFDGWLADLHYKLMLDDISLGLKEFLDKNQKFTVSQLNREVFIPARDKEIVARIKQHVKDKGIVQPKMVIYCKTIKHARRIATIYGRDQAVAIHAKQSAEEVKEILKRLERGEIEAVTSVQKLNEGIDLPSLNMLVFLRNTVSRNVYEQQLGRGTRREGNKTAVEILDFVANAEWMKFVFEFWQELQDRTRRYYGGEEIDGADEDDELVDVNIDESNTKITTNLKAKSPRKPRSTRAKDDKIPKFDRHFVLDFYDGKFEEQDIDIMGILERAYQGREWTEEEGLAALAEYAKELGRAPTQIEVNANPDLPSVSWYKRHFGSYNNALLKLGFAPNFRQWTKKEGLIGLANYAKQLNCPPTCRQVDANPDLPSSEWYIKHFGSYRNALKEIGIRADFVDWTKEDGLAGLAEFAKMLGYPPSRRQVDANPDLPHSAWYKQRFGSYNNAIALIGFTPYCHLWISERALEVIRQESEKQNKILTQVEVNANRNLPTSGTLVKLFGSFTNAKNLVLYTYQSVALPPKEDLDSDEVEKTDVGEAEDPSLLDPEGSSN